MEQSLKYVGMAGFIPEVPDGPSSPIDSGPEYTGNTSPHWTTSVGNLISTLASLGMTAAQIISATKGNQPIIVANPNTGAQTNVTPLLREEMDKKGEEKLMQMMNLVIASLNNRPQPQPKDNTLLYVGIGFGALVLIGLMAFSMKK